VRHVHLDGHVISLDAENGGGANSGEHMREPWPTWYERSASFECPCHRPSSRHEDGTVDLSTRSLRSLLRDDS
jgi:hypothetical protein